MANKRFTSAIDSNGLKSIFDNEREDCNEPILFNCIGDVDTVVDLLNELSDENQRLSHKANFWHKKYRVVKTTIMRDDDL